MTTELDTELLQLLDSLEDSFIQREQKLDSLSKRVSEICDKIAEIRDLVDAAKESAA